MLNRGNIVFNLLPVLALVLCGIAFFSFLTLNDKLNQPSREFSSMVSDLGIMQQYIEESAKLIVSDCQSKAFSKQCVQESAERHDLHIEGQGNFFIKVAEGEFTIEKSGNFVMFEIDDVFIQSRKGSNLGQRNIHMVLEADTNGEFIKFINK